MEPDQPRGRNTDPAPSLDQDQHVTLRDQGAIRSYECVFCKRGFTNAQALGGHMNIHRKEKARLKQYCSNFDETQPAMEVSKMSSSYPPIPLSDFLPLESKNPNPAWISAAEIRGSKRDETVLVEEGLHLPPLFTETPSSSDKKTAPHLHEMLDHHGTAQPTEISARSEIDLELRLGPEPKDSSAGPTSTRQFF